MPDCTTRNSTWCSLLLAVVAAQAQTVTVRSEFTRTDPFGEIVRADRSAVEPREILSPAMGRNAFASVQVVVEGRAGQSYRLEIAQNPSDSVRIGAYRETYTRLGDAWIPDILEPVRTPYEAKLGDDVTVPAQTAQSFWVDLIAGARASVRRIRVEIQVLIDGGWIVYPMEVRIRPPVLDSQVSRGMVGAGDLAAPLMWSAFAGWSGAMCAPPGVKESTEVTPSIRAFVARNAGQDVLLSRGTPPDSLLRLAGARDVAAFCGGAKAQPGEAYLVIRDALIHARE